MFYCVFANFYKSVLCRYQVRSFLRIRSFSSGLHNISYLFYSQIFASISYSQILAKATIRKKPRFFANCYEPQIFTNFRRFLRSENIKKRFAESYELTQKTIRIYLRIFAKNHSLLYCASQHYSLKTTK